MRNVQYHEGLPSTYWLTVAGYIAAGVLMVGLFVSGYLNSESDAGFRTVGMTIGLLTGVYSFGGAVSYVAIFKDSAYIRSARSGWMPRWWRYIGAGIGAPVVLYAGAMFIISNSMAGGLAVMLHALSALTVSALYLYRRHQHIGVP